MSRLVRHRLHSATLWLSLVAVAGCGDEEQRRERLPGEHGPIAEGISAPMGEPRPDASAEQLEAFERGREVALRRFDLGSGLGPAFNVTFCASCHERPVFGGAAGLYRNFFLSGVRADDGAFFPGDSAGMSGGVIRLYYYDTEVGEAREDADDEVRSLARPPVPEDTNVVAVRNPIPFFGVGLLAELPEDEILKRADPADRELIFTPFATGKTRGTGLGLAVAKRITELHGGTIAIGDGDGGGAVFTVTIPPEGS